MRSVSQIYSEAVTVRNNYLQLTELNSGRSNSKLSILNLLTYVVAVCIHTYETVLDLFQVRMAEVLKGRINGTPDWYAAMARKFQFNPVTGYGDELRFNEDTLKIEYVKTDTGHRIIRQAAWQMNELDGGLILKVCKANSDSNETNAGVPYMKLDDSEMTAFKMFIEQIKFVGADIQCLSLPADIVTIVADRENPIFYNDSYITAAQAMENIRKSIVSFAGGLEFNGMFYYQAVLDALRKAEHISDIGHNIKVYVSSYNETEGRYGEAIELNGRTRLKSGYVRFLGEDSEPTVNASNITLVPFSKMDRYYDSLEKDV